MTDRSRRGIFSGVRSMLPAWAWAPIGRLGTAVLTPIRFSWRSGHFRSSLRMGAVSRSGELLPWYTYPCIDFLRWRSFGGKAVLEFGGGHSTLWWASRAKEVVTFEGDGAWHRKLATMIPSNVDLHLVAMETPVACVESVRRILDADPDRRFDVVVIDGLWRYEMIDIAVGALTDTGIILCDNAEGYDFYEGFRHRPFQRVDFFGYAPGVIRPHCTSIFFTPRSFAFDPMYPIPVIAQDS